MASDINQGFVVGRLTRDAENRSSQSGGTVLRFSVASSRTFIAGTERQEKTSFLDCVMFGKRATALAPYLTKGTQVAVQYRLDQETWEGKDGQRRNRVVLMVEDIELLGSRQDGGQRPQDGGQNPPQRAQSPADTDWEDIPF